MTGRRRAFLQVSQPIIAAMLKIRTVLHSSPFEPFDAEQTMVIRRSGKNPCIPFPRSHIDASETLPQWPSPR